MVARVADAALGGTWGPQQRAGEWLRGPLSGQLRRVWVWPLENGEGDEDMGMGTKQPT